MNLTPPALIAYRGGDGVENDLETMRRSAALHPLLTIEVDVRFTQDGVPVAHHDATVNRMTDGRGRLTELTWSQLQRLRLPSGGRVPSLEQVLARVDNPLLLDLRVEREREVDALVELARCATERLVLVSESEACLRKVTLRLPDVPFGASRRRAWACLLGLPAARAPIWMVPSRLGPWSPVAAFARARRMDERLWVFVVDELAEAQALRRRGADGFITRHPERLLRLTP